MFRMLLYRLSMRNVMIQQLLMNEKDCTKWDWAVSKCI